MDSSEIGFIALGAVAVGSLLLIWLGFKVLFLPLQLSLRFGRVLAKQIGPIALTLVLAWTVALEPEPFVYLWGWFLRLGKGLLVDAPRQVLPIVTQAVSVCSGTSASTCYNWAAVVAAQLWSAAISQP